MGQISIDGIESSIIDQNLRSGSCLIETKTYSKSDIDINVSRPGITKAINIGFINNMQGASNAATERYFRRLISRSAGELPICLAAFSPLSIQEKSIPAPFEIILEQLSNFEPDALIMTGMEPSTPDLRHEPLWPFMSKVFDWAESRVIPTILSCLAAHAAVLHSDGIARTPLKEKRFGIFEHRLASEHFLTRGLPGTLRVPHSRWNEIDPSRLTNKGYQILTCSDAAGVDMFVKQRRSLFVHFQGHMEYTAETLCSEYKRDVRRFLAGKRADYPSTPQGYFNKKYETALDAFREQASIKRSPGLWKLFPAGLEPAELAAAWDEPAKIVFRNFLNYVRDAND